MGELLVKTSMPLPPAKEMISHGKECVNVLQGMRKPFLASN
jgi:hypothetical protein